MKKNHFVDRSFYFSKNLLILWTTYQGRKNYTKMTQKIPKNDQKFQKIESRWSLKPAEDIQSANRPDPRSGLSQSKFTVSMNFGGHKKTPLRKKKQTPPPPPKKKKMVFFFFFFFFGGGRGTFCVYVH